MTKKLNGRSLAKCIKYCKLSTTETVVFKGQKNRTVEDHSSKWSRARNFLIFLARERPFKFFIRSFEIGPSLREKPPCHSKGMRVGDAHK